MKVHCLYDQLINFKDLKFHPKNPNKHTDNQIKRLSEILLYQGWRYPIKVSKRSGFVTSGHGRALAALENKWTEVPVNFQDYENEDQEYADIVSDNSIASWSELDLSMVNLELANFSPEFNLDLLGISNFKMDFLPVEKEVDENLSTEKECPSCGYKY